MIKFSQATAFHETPFSIVLIILQISQRCNKSGSNYKTCQYSDGMANEFVPCFSKKNDALFPVPDSDKHILFPKSSA